MRSASGFAPLRPCWRRFRHNDRRKGPARIKLTTQKLLLLTCAASGAALPQLAPFGPAAQPPGARRGTFAPVRVNVIVRDRHGEPVRDVKKQDFRVYDSGKSQQISDFAMDSDPLPPGVQALPPNIFTNWGAGKMQSPSSITVILLDALNSQMEDRRWVKKQIFEFLSTTRPEDRVEIYALGHGFHIIHDFRSGSSLKEPVRRHGAQRPETAGSDGGSFTPAPADPAVVAFNAWLTGAGVSREESEFYSADPVAGTARALQVITNHIAGVPGRKNLIWVSGEFPDDALLALHNANVAIYPVDARGLHAQQRFTVERPAPIDPHNQQQPFTTNSPGKILESERKQRTANLAESTGGRAYLNTNDLAKAIRDAVEDSAFTYTLGFYPDGHANDGKFHKIEVKIPERSGLNLHYRKRYLVWADQPRDGMVRRNELQNAVRSPLESSGIGMTVQIAPADAGRPDDLNVLLGIDTAGVGLTPEGDRRTGALDMVFIQKAADGRAFEGENTTVMLRITPESYEKYRHGLRYQRFVPRQTGATQLRVIVRDVSTGTVGSVTVPFDQIR